MPPRDVPFDPADYAEGRCKSACSMMPLVSQDVAFVTAALKTILEVRGMPARTIGLDPHLSDVLAVCEALGIDLTAAGREP